MVLRIIKRTTAGLMAVVLVLLCGCAGAQTPSSSGEQGIPPVTSASQGQPDVGETPSPAPEGTAALYLTGDVFRSLTLEPGDADSFEWGEVEYGGQTLPALKLRDLIGAAEPRVDTEDDGPGYTMLLRGEGEPVEIGGAKKYRLAWDEADGWVCVDTENTGWSGPKNLTSVVVVTKEGEVDTGEVGFINGQEYRRITPGQMMRMETEGMGVFERQDVVDGETVAVSAPYYRMPLARFLPEDVPICVVGRNGSQTFLPGGANTYVVQAGNRMDFIYEDGTYNTDIAGIMVDAPALNITQVYHDSVAMLQEGTPVLMIELDGFGLYMCETAAREGNAPYVGALERRIAMAMYPPYSQVGLASMLTGTLPNVHGVHSREDEVFEGEDIFATVAGMGLKAAYVEGDDEMLVTSIDPVISTDLNGDGYNDDEVLQNARDQIANVGPDFMYVHFHGIDDIATSMGPYNYLAMERIKLVDSYVQMLVGEWYGRVIITADHGLHEVPKGGIHYTFMPDDMLVPYIVI